MLHYAFTGLGKWTIQAARCHRPLRTKKVPGCRPEDYSAWRHLGILPRSIREGCSGSRLWTLDSGSMPGMTRLFMHACIPSRHSRAGGNLPGPDQVWNPLGGCRQHVDPGSLLRSARDDKKSNTAPFCLYPRRLESRHRNSSGTHSSFNRCEEPYFPASARLRPRLAHRE